MTRQPFLSVTLKDCDIQTFSAGGPGGQHQNTSNTGVRIIHRASGARGESREERSQLQNKKAAFRRMAQSKRFQVWVNRQVWFKGELPEQRVKEDMKPANLRVDGKKDGKWVPIEETEDAGEWFCVCSCWRCGPVNKHDCGRVACSGSRKSV